MKTIDKGYIIDGDVRGLSEHEVIILKNRIKEKVCPNCGYDVDHDDKCPKKGE